MISAPSLARHCCVLLLAGLLARPTLAETPSSEIIAASELAKLLEIAGADNQVVDHLDYLVNNIGARLSGSPADHRACDWAVKKFKEWGLENVVLEEAGQFPVGFHRGPWQGQMVAPTDLRLEFGTPAWSAGTPGAVEGPARLAPASAEGLKAEDFRGAWILRQRGRRLRNREAQQAARSLEKFLEDAGIAGYVSPSRGKYIYTAGSSPKNFESRPRTPRITLLESQWKQIAALLEEDKEVRLRFDIRNHFIEGPAKYYNVLADLPGRPVEEGGRPDELVVIGGHIDSWDGATGTTDNGCGVAVAMETARLLAKAGVKPRRTIRFMLWSGEEQGLLGSRSWVDRNKDLLPKVSGCFVYDGGPNAIAGVDSSAAMYEQMEKVFAPIMALNEKYPFTIKKQPGLRSNMGSDHAAFLSRGVPGFFWDQKGRADWRHGIHTQFDTFDLCIPEYLRHSAVVSSLAALGVANLEDLLSRENMKAGNERRPQRQGRRMGVYLDGLAVQNVVPGSVAQKAGIQAGDRFVEVEGKKVEDRADLVIAITEGLARKKVKLERDGKALNLVLEWPEELARQKAEAEKAAKEAGEKPKAGKRAEL